MGEDPSVAALRELCPDATSEQILQSVNRNRGDVTLAAQELLGLSQDSFSHGEDREIRSAVEDIHAIKLRSLLYRIAWWLLTFTSLAPDTSLAHIAEHHLKTNHRIDWDSAECVTYSTDYYQRITHVVETSVNATSNSPSQDYTHPDDHNLPNYEN